MGIRARRGALLGVAALAWTLAPAEAGAATNVRLVVDGPWDRNEAFLRLYENEMATLLGDEFGVTFPDGSVSVADWTVDGVHAAVTAALEDPAVDVVVGLGVLASQDLCRRGDLPKPGIAPFVIDPRLQGVPMKDGVSGVRNLSYLTSVGRVEHDFRLFLEVVPFRSLVFLTVDTMLEAIPGLPAAVRAAGAGLGIAVTVRTLPLAGADPIDVIPADAEAVYAAPLLAVSDARFDALVAGLIERKLPSFSLFGRGEVDRGILAGGTAEKEMGRRARRTALNVQRMLLGDDGGALPVLFSEGEHLSLNLGTARAIGVRPTWAVLTAAEVVDRERTQAGRRLTFAGAVREAIAVNRDLQAAEHTVAAGRHQVGVSRSPLLPQAEVSATGSWIDKDLAAASFGTAERQLSGALSVTQLLLSDGAWAALDIEQRQQLIRELTRDGVRLDVARDASRAYLNVLRALARERIQRENLDRTRAHLDLARVRESVGYSGPGETIRWEGEIATRQRDLIQANADRNVAEIALNRLLHRPLEEAFTAEDVDLAKDAIGVTDPRLGAFLGDPWSFRVLRAFLEEEAMETSPEVAALDAGIGARGRALSAAERAFWVPTVGLSGELSHLIGQDGEGSDGGSLGLIPTPPDTRWSVGVRASLPLLEGGARLARRRGAQESLLEMERERESVAERVRQGVRSAMHRAGASFAGIGLSRRAADAAHRNLELVADAYGKGAVSVIDLLDAQNASLVAEEGSANAELDFLLDLTDVQRAVGSFFCLDEPHARNDFLDRLERFRDEQEEK